MSKHPVVYLQRATASERGLWASSAASSSL
jgi:hypothetical protein